MTTVRAEGVGFVYPDGTRAIERIDLTIKPGETVAIVGQNGSGKSTFVRMLNGLLRPTEGVVSHDGQDVAGQRVAALAARVGIVFQNPDRQIFAGKVREEVAFGPKILGRSSEQVTASVTAALEAVGLADVADQNPYDLGYSKRKLLALASVLAMDTAVIVLDEPTTGQDARGIARVQDVVAAVAASGRTVIAISHDMRFVAESFGRGRGHGRRERAARRAAGRGLRRGRLADARLDLSRGAATRRSSERGWDSAPRRPRTHCSTLSRGASGRRQLVIPTSWIVPSTMRQARRLGSPVAGSASSSSSETSRYRASG